MDVRAIHIAAAVAASAALTGALAGCGTVRAGTVTSAGPTSATVAVGAAAQLQKAGDSTSAAKSAKVLETITEAGQTRTATGELSWANGTQSVLHMQVSAAEQAKVGSDGTADAVYTPTAMFLNPHADAQFTQALGGAHWMEFDFADLARTQGSAGAAFQAEAKSADPLTLVRALVVTGKVTSAGPESISGIPTTHYTADLTPADLAGTNASAADREQLGIMQQLLKARGVTNDHIDLWVDSNNLLVKKDEKLATATGTQEIAVSYSDYGVQFAATPPAAYDTFNAGKPLASKQPGVS